MFHVHQNSLETFQNKKYNCRGLPTFKIQTEGYQSNQKLLHQYQHSRNQLNL